MCHDRAPLACDIECFVLMTTINNAPCAYDRPGTMRCVVHSLDHCSWTLFFFKKKSTKLTLG